MESFNVPGALPLCRYNTGVECPEKKCPATCGWRPQIAGIRHRKINGGKGLVEGPDGLLHLPVRERRPSA